MLPGGGLGFEADRAVEEAGLTAWGDGEVSTIGLSSE